MELLKPFQNETLSSFSPCPYPPLLNNSFAQELIPALECGTSASTPSGQTTLPANYLPICTDPDEIKYIRLIFHFLLPTAPVVIDSLVDCDPTKPYIHYVGRGNFTEYGDGFTSNGPNGYKWAEDVVKQANWELDNNEDQWRKANDPNVQNPPLNITYPVDPPEVKHRYLLTGVYFHEDDYAYFLPNDFDDRDPVFNLYAIDKTEAINVFYTPNGPWSGVASNIGGSTKYIFNNDYLTYVTCRGWSVPFSGYLLNHEVGHTLGRKHTWNEDDICLDTPMGFVYDKWYKDDNGVWHCDLDQFANCWNVNDTPTCPTSMGEKPCDLPGGSWRKISNNMMDYNQWISHAFTVCQINSMNADLMGPGNGFVHSCNGCMPSIAFFAMPDVYRMCTSELPNAGFYLNGTASFNENKWLVDICEVNPSQPDVCIGNNLNTGWQTGQVGKFNLRSFYQFQPNKHYRVKLIVDNTECPLSDEFSKVLQTLSCNDNTVENERPALELTATNPFDSEISIFYSLSSEGMVQIQLTNILTGTTQLLLPSTETSTGEYRLVVSSGSFPPGSYALQAACNGQTVTKIILKP